MANETSVSQSTMVLGFLAILFGVPGYQVVVELNQHQPVQATNLFRQPPTVSNLRNFEQTLEDSWWGQESVRPWMQQGLYLAIHDTGAKAVPGRDGWLFYRPSIEYLIERNRAEDEQGDLLQTPSWARQTRRDSVVQAIVAYRDELAQRAITLLVVPVPSKASVYPEMLTHRFADRPDTFRSPTEELLEELDRRDVATVNLFEVFRRARAAEVSVQSRDTYYLAHDTHWTPSGARVAANAVARRLQELNDTSEYPFEYAAQPASVVRRGDILEMMSIPAASRDFKAEEVACEQILDPLVGLMVPQPDARPGRFKNDHLIDTPMESTVLVLGDSFCRIYETAEPASLGTVNAVDVPKRPGGEDGRREEGQPSPKKRLLPGSAGFPSLLAYELKAPVDYIVSDGGAATDVRQRLSVDPEMLDNKRVVIWEFAERDVQSGSAGWSFVPLPPAQ